MVCAHCGQKNRAEARFCDQCRKPLSPCNNCGHANRPHARYCDECGATLALSSRVEERSAIPPSYAPRLNAEQTLSRRGAREGERKLITVLFADIADSSALAQQLEPEALRDVLDGVLRLLAEVVHGHDGIISHYLGDGLMALFGAPIALEDHALRAVRAGLQMQEMIGARNDELHREYGVTISLRVGLDTGQVVVGPIGDDLRMDYTATGNTAHLAARMEALAEPGTVLITDATWRVVAAGVEAERLGPVLAKGQRQAVVVYRVTCLKPLRRGLGHRTAKHLTKLIGRGAELALMRQLLAEAASGRGRSVAIAGEPGLGKSRLMHEFRSDRGIVEAEWLEGGCVANGQGVPYAPFLEILGSLFDIEEKDPPSVIGIKLAAGATALGFASEKLPFLEFLFSIPGHHDELQALGPRIRRERIWETIIELFEAASRQRPLVLAVENLHWADQSSEDFVGCLAERVAVMPVLLLTTHRPGYRSRWAGSPGFVQIDLEPFRDQEVLEMLSALLGSEHVAAPLLRYVVEKSGGNPLFIEEISQVLLERDFVVRTTGRLELERAAELELPPTVQGIIQARVDGPGDAVKETLQIAAVTGLEFDLRLLAAVSEAPRDVPAHIDELKRLELILPTGSSSLDEYRFKHAIIRDVIYASLLTRRRQALHIAVGHMMEALGRREEAPTLARHFAEGADRKRAIPYALTAGDQAARMFANTEAAAFYEQALHFARSLPQEPDAQRAEIDAAVKLAGVSRSREARVQDQQNLEAALALADGLNDEPRQSSVLYWLGRIAYVRGDFRRASEYSEKSLVVADRCDDEALAAPPTNLMGRSCYLTGECDRAAQLLARSVEQMHAIGDVAEEATAAGYAGVAFAAMGAFDEALSYADRGIRLALELRNPYAEAAAYNYRAVAYCQQGSTAAAIADCEQTRQIAEQIGDQFRIYLVQFYEGQAYTMTGNFARARELLEDSIAKAGQMGTTTLLAWGQGLLATALLEFGERDTTVLLCREAIALAEQTVDCAAKALAQRTLAMALASELTTRSEAQTTISEAMKSQRQFRCEPELGRSHIAYAQMLAAWGRNDEAARHRSEALATFRRLGMLEEVARAERTPMWSET